MRMAKVPRTNAISAYIPAPDSVKMRKEIEEYYAGIIPQMRRAFAAYVFKRGNGALAPTFDKSGRQESWQAVGRRLYGPEFMNDLKAVVDESRVVAQQ